MSLYSCTQIRQLMDHYFKVGGAAYQVHEGGLGYGKMILAAPGYKYAIITERYINEWSSGHTIRLDNKLPEKYAMYLY